MHYIDEEHIKNNILKIVLYKHDVLDSTDDEILVDYEIASIQKCRYINPRVLFKYIKNPNKHLCKIKEIDELKTEEWWLITLVQNKWDKLSLVSVKNVSNNDDNFLRLH